MDWFLYDNGLRLERVKKHSDEATVSANFFLVPYSLWLLISQTGIFQPGKGLHNSQKLRKVVAIYKTDKLILSK